MKLGVQVGLGPDHIVLGRDPAPPPPKAQNPRFSAHIYCGQMAGWIKMPLGMEMCLGPGHIVLEWDPASSPPQKKGTEPPNFRPIYIVAERLDASRCHLLWRSPSAQVTLC